VDGNVYLRCWGDYYRYSLVVTEGPEASLGRMAWRTNSQAALEAAAERIEATGVQGTWTAGGHGYGKAYEFTGPFGHHMRMFYEVEKFVAEPGFKSTYPDRPERRSSHAAAPRFLDHVTVATSHVRAFAKRYNEALGFRGMAFVDLDEAPITVFSVLTTNEIPTTLALSWTLPTTPAASTTSPSGWTPPRTCSAPPTPRITATATFPSRQRAPRASLPPTPPQTLLARHHPTGHCTLKTSRRTGAAPHHLLRRFEQPGPRRHSRCGRR
jgi:hypothetical protein